MSENANKLYNGHGIKLCQNGQEKGNMGQNDKVWDKNRTRFRYSIALFTTMSFLSSYKEEEEEEEEEGVYIEKEKHRKIHREISANSFQALQVGQM